MIAKMTPTTFNRLMTAGVLKPEQKPSICGVDIKVVLHREIPTDMAVVFEV